jgi:hypothetical protein
MRSTLLCSSTTALQAGRRRCAIFTLGCEAIDQSECSCVKRVWTYGGQCFIHFAGLPLLLLRIQSRLRSTGANRRSVIVICLQSFSRVRTMQALLEVLSMYDNSLDRIDWDEVLRRAAANQMRSQFPCSLMRMPPGDLHR